MANNFTIEGRAFGAGFKDIQRTWLWELSFDLPTIVLPKVTGFYKNGDGGNRMIVHCRTAVIPGRTQAMIDSNFGGMKQWFAGKTEFPYTFGVTIEENEDMFVRKTLHGWQESIFQVQTGATQGHSVTTNKRSLVSDNMSLQLFRFDGEPAEKKFKFKNGILQGIGDVSVSYDDNASVKYDATFQYDFFELVDSKK